MLDDQHTTLAINEQAGYIYIDTCTKDYMIILYTSLAVETSLLDISKRQQQAIAEMLLYMSPEQREGKGCDHKADIYALGVIFFELNYPFTTDNERFKVPSKIIIECYII